MYSKRSFTLDQQANQILIRTRGLLATLTAIAKRKANSGRTSIL